MRPSLLDPLFAALTTLARRRAEAGEALSPAVRPRGRAGARHRSAVPSADRHHRPPRAAEAARRRAGLGRHRRGDGRPPSPAAAEPSARCPTGSKPATTPATLTLTYFHAKRDYLEKLFPVGELRYVSGTTALYDGMLQMVHPDRVVSEAELDKLPLVEPVYPLTEGLTLNPVRKARRSRADENPGAAGMAGRGLARSARAFPPSPGRCSALHHPAEPADIAAGEHGLVAARL